MPFGFTEVKKEKRQRMYKDKWARMSRVAHLAMLSRPQPRMLQPWPNPQLVCEVPRRITQASLVYKPSRRILLLSRPTKTIRRHVKPAGPESYVHPEALRLLPSPRVLQLSRRQLPEELRPKEVDPKLLKKMRKYAEKRGEWLAAKAVPKRQPPPPPLLKFKWSGEAPTAEERNEKVRKLALPRKYLPPREDVFVVSSKALKYEASPRVVELALPRELPSEAFLDLTYKPYKIKKGALQYVATENITRLAQPIIRKQAEDYDVKENPFSVVPRSLKAICTRRTAELAKPVKRE